MVSSRITCSRMIICYRFSSNLYGLRDRPSHSVAHARTPNLYYDRVSDDNEDHGRSYRRLPPCIKKLIYTTIENISVRASAVKTKSLTTPTFKAMTAFESNNLTLPQKLQQPDGHDLLVYEVNVRLVDDANVQLGLVQRQYLYFHN